MAGVVVVFDFDKTIIDCDSDNWVVDELGLTELFEQLLPTMPWNTLMDRIMKELQSRGRTIDDIIECLKRTPLVPHIISTIKSVQSLGCELRILSDANLFYIDTILEHHGLRSYFSEINSNPSFVEEGRLCILPYHDFLCSPHGCDLCPPNMCKSVVIERMKASALADGSRRFIYLGDGKGDFCPSLRLGEKDYVLPRKNYPLWELIRDQPFQIRAGIHEWENGEDLEKTLRHLIIEENNKKLDPSPFMSAECKFQTVSVSVHEETFPQALSVRQ